MKKKKKTWILIVLLLLLAAGGAFYLLRIKPQMQQVQEAIKATPMWTIARGDVEASITANGNLDYMDEMEVRLPEGIICDNIFPVEGDRVNRGDVLATLNSTSLKRRAAELSAELTDLDRTLGNFKSTGNITTPVKGRIKYLHAAKQDDVIEAVNQYGCLALLSTDELMQVRIATERQLLLASEVTIRWSTGSEKGKVAARTEEGYLITLEDKSAPYGEMAEVYAEGISIGSGKLEIHAPLAIFGNGGTIDEVNYKVDAQVSAGNTLFTLVNKPATDAYRKALADREEKADEFQQILRYQQNPHLICPQDGVVLEIGAEEGKKLSLSGDDENVLVMKLGVGGAVKMTVHVDEIDIGSVAVNQEARVTLDAFPSESFEAKVMRIARNGSINGSITEYKTELQLKADERLLAGMNGSAVIISDKVENVPVVPLHSVHEDATGSFVYVLDSDGNQVRQSIVTGLSDGNQAEIVSGISEGAEIVSGETNHSALFFPTGMGGRGYSGSYGR